MIMMVTAKANNISNSTPHTFNTDVLCLIAKNTVIQTINGIITNIFRTLLYLLLKLYMLFGNHTA